MGLTIAHRGMKMVVDSDATNSAFGTEHRPILERQAGQPYRTEMDNHLEARSYMSSAVAVVNIVVT